MLMISHGNILLSDNEAICVTTNGVVQPSGDLVMGAGVARAFRDRYPDLPRDLGSMVRSYGNIVHMPPGYDSPCVISFPTKHDWRHDSDPDLIVASAIRLQEIIDLLGLSSVGLPCPGTRNGGLDIDKSLSLISDYIDHDVVTIYV